MVRLLDGHLDSAPLLLMPSRGEARPGRRMDRESLFTDICLLCFASLCFLPSASTTIPIASCGSARTRVCWRHLQIFFSFPSPSFVGIDRSRSKGGVSQDCCLVPATTPGPALFWGPGTGGHRWPVVLGACSRARLGVSSSDPGTLARCLRCGLPRATGGFGGFGGKLPGEVPCRIYANQALRAAGQRR
jgi:hypothetical protein